MDTVALRLDEAFICSHTALLRPNGVCRPGSGVTLIRLIYFRGTPPRLQRINIVSWVRCHRLHHEISCTSTGSLVRCPGVEMVSIILRERCTLLRLSLFLPSCTLLGCHPQHSFPRCLLLQAAVKSRNLSIF